MRLVAQMTAFSNLRHRSAWPRRARFQLIALLSGCLLLGMTPGLALAVEGESDASTEECETTELFAVNAPSIQSQRKRSRAQRRRSSRGRPAAFSARRFTACSIPVIDSRIACRRTALLMPPCHAGIAC